MHKPTSAKHTSAQQRQSSTLPQEPLKLLRDQHKNTDQGAVAQGAKQPGIPLPQVGHRPYCVGHLAPPHLLHPHNAFSGHLNGQCAL